jgi:FKBP-type peptidyl-prolyl cis-trans isomerase
MATREPIIKALLKSGNGAKPSKGQTITVQCTGVVKASGKKFWSTKDAGQKPFTFQVGLGKVIRGWDEGCLDMQLGEESTLDVRSDWAYGAGGFPAWGIPENADLLFTIEILSIE